MTSFTFLLTPVWIGPQHLMSSRCSDAHLVFSFPLAISSLFLHHCTTDSTRIVSLDHFPPPLSDAHPSPLCISGAVFLLFDCCVNLPAVSCWCLHLTMPSHVLTLAYISASKHLNFMKLSSVSSIHSALALL